MDATVVLATLITTVGTIASAWISSPKSKESIDTQIQTPAVGSRPIPSISSAIYFGGVSLFAWLLPLLGLPISLVGLGLGIAHRSEPSPRRFATTGIYLNVIGLMCATANSAIGAYVGYKGLH